jgi:pSer/pThr/pTyr-binding forkhead associated (FHA) protein
MADKRTGTGGAATAERVVRKPPFAAPYVYVLAVVDGEQPAAVYRLSAARTVVGRGPEADCVVDDDEVSKNHLVFTVDGPVCCVSDSGSLNGSKLNGRPLRPPVAHRLRHLDEIEIGTTRLLFLRGRFQEAPPKS